MYAGFKYYLIRGIALHTPNYRGEPIWDFVAIPPIGLALGSTVLLKDYELYPFAYFGLVLYVMVAGIFYAILKTAHNVRNDVKSER